MANLAKIDFLDLDITGKSYLSWILDAEIHLESIGFRKTMQENNDVTSQEKAKAMIFLRRHLDKGLKSEYLIVKDLEDLWINLKERYDKSVVEYNSKMFKISSKLKLCGERITDEEMLEKKFSTFHASNVLLQQQYRERGFRKYSKLISCLLVAEQNNELLMRNHESRPTGSMAFPKVNAMSSNRGHGHGQNHGRGHNRGRGRGRGRNHVWHRNGYKPNPSKFKKTMHDEGKGKSHHATNSKATDSICYRCGIKKHWSRSCRMVKYLVELYQASQKEKEKNTEINFTDQGNTSYFDLSEMTHLDTTDFFEQANRNMLSSDDMKLLMED